MSRTYTQLLNHAIGLYKEGRYAEAYDEMTRDGPTVQGNQAQVYNFRYCFACKMGEIELARSIFQEALDKGYWYSPEYLRADDDLAPLRALSSYQCMIDLCEDRQKEAQLSAKPELSVLQSGHGRTPSKLLLAMHGNDENAHLAELQWGPAASMGRVVALPQSSQVSFWDAYCWNDVEKGCREVEAHYASLISGGAIAPEDMVIGGFSAGGRLALRLMMLERVPAKRFFLICPWLPEIEEWAPLIPRLKKNIVDGRILCGERDDCLEGGCSPLRAAEKGRHTSSAGNNQRITA